MCVTFSVKEKLTKNDLKPTDLHSGYLTKFDRIHADQLDTSVVREFDYSRPACEVSVSSPPISPDSSVLPVGNQCHESARSGSPQNLTSSWLSRSAGTKHFHMALNGSRKCSDNRFDRNVNLIKIFQEQHCHPLANLSRNDDHSR